MKKTLLIFVLFFVSFYCKAEYELLFCTNADSLGNCKSKGETFAWNGDKTDLTLIVMNKEKLGVSKLNLMLFAMSNDKEGTLYAELEINRINPDALFAIKKMYFYKPGYYRVEVLDENHKPLTNGYVTILDRVE